jgi:hypothetical protein
MGELAFELLAALMTTPPLIAQLARNIATHIRADQSLSAGDLVIVIDPNTAHISGQLAEPAGEIFATNRGGNAV